MSAVVPKKKRAHQSASQAPARRSGERGNTPTSSFRTPHSGDPESSVLLVEREALDVDAVREASTADGVRKNWRVLPLGEVVEILDSRRVPVNSAERAKRVGNVPYYGATGQVGVIDEHIFDEELVLLGEDGAPFWDAAKPKAYLIRGKSWVNNHAHVLRGKLGLLNSFLLYQLNSIDYRPFVSGTTRLKLPQGPMKRIPLLVPPENEQRQIVAEIEKQFTRLDAGMAALRRVQVNLKRYRAAVLKAACEGRLVPTEAELAKAEGRTCETGEQLLARILADRRKNWHGRGKYKEPAAPDTTNLPLLPEGWTWSTMPQLGELNRGKSKHRPRDDVQLYGGPYPFIQTGDVRKSNGTIRDYTQTYSEFGLQQSRLWPEGTLCITIAANIAATGILKFKACFPDSVVGFTQNEDSATTRYVEFFIRTAKEKLEQFAPATAQKNINLDVLQNVAVPLPPLAEQTRIVAEVERRLSVIEELEAAVTANLQRAIRLRQSILRRAFGLKKGEVHDHSD
jgi:type I restriction enzyme S subunit